MQIAGHDIGVCSWSLKTATMGELVERVRSLGLGHIQLALGGLIGLNDAQRREELATLRGSGLVITSGMMGFAGEDYSSIASIRRTGGFVPDELWDERRARMERAVALAEEMGLKAVSTHIGFVPPSSQSAYRSMIQRICDVAGPMGERGIDLLLETGQESAPELLQFLNDLNCRNVFANFDPANMILYGAGEPIEAIRILGRHIAQVHIKDAVLSDAPGQEWGREVPFGSGQVGPKRLLTALKSVGYAGPLVIEREAGPDRMADVAAGIEALRSAARDMA